MQPVWPASKFKDDNVAFVSKSLATICCVVSCCIVHVWCSAVAMMVFKTFIAIEKPFAYTMNVSIETSFIKL